MPISNETFTAGEERYSIENEIVQFLYDNPEEAYNVYEITVEDGHGVVRSKRRRTDPR